MPPLTPLGEIYESRDEKARALETYSRLAALHENAEPRFKSAYDRARAGVLRLTDPSRTGMPVPRRAQRRATVVRAIGTPRPYAF